MGWIGTITNAGAAMLAQIAGGGHTLTILSASAGTGTRSQSEMASATALVAEKGEITIAEKQYRSDCVKIWTRISPISAAYTVKEIGVWAKVDDGSKTLFSIHQNTDGVIIPSSSDDPNFIFDLICTYAPSNMDNFSVTVDPTSVVTQTQIADVVRFTDQVLTDAQKTRVQENIGAAPESRFTNGVLNIDNGGTGLAASPSMLVALDSRVETNIFQSHPRPGTSGILPVAKGGTGVDTLNKIRSALGLGANLGVLSTNYGGTGKSSASAAANSFAESLSLSSDALSDSDYMFAGSNGSYVRRTLSLLWNYIKSKFMPNGYVPVSNGGTGATTAAGARNALGLGNTAGALPIENGGTGATTVAAARNALGLGNTSGALPVANGGTGRTSLETFLTDLGLVYKSVASKFVILSSSDCDATIESAYKYGKIVSLIVKANFTSESSAGVRSRIVIVCDDNTVRPYQYRNSGNAIEYDGNSAYDVCATRNGTTDTSMNIIVTFRPSSAFTGPVYLQFMYFSAE